MRRKEEKEEEDKGKRTRRIEKRREAWRRKEERAKKAQSRAEWRGCEGKEKGPEGDGGAATWTSAMTPFNFSTFERR